MDILVLLLLLFTHDFDLSSFACGPDYLIEKIKNTDAKEVKDKLIKCIEKYRYIFKGLEETSKKCDELSKLSPDERDARFQTQYTCEVKKND